MLTRVLLSLWLGRMMEEAVVEVSIKPIPFLLKEQKVLSIFVLAAELRQKSLFDVKL